MTKEMMANPSYVISNEILDQKSFFTVRDIVDKVKDKLLKSFKDIDDLFVFVKKKLESFCEVRLISFNGFEYYVNS